jgi:hypothetical protein
VYSPKIAERLIPVLFYLARARRQHMTTLVAEALDAYLAQQDLAQVLPPHLAAGSPEKERTKTGTRRAA